MFKVKVTQNYHILRLKLVTHAFPSSPSMPRFKKGGVRLCRAAVMEERLMHRDATLDRQEWIE